MRCSRTILKKGVVYKHKFIYIGGAINFKMGMSLQAIDAAVVTLQATLINNFGPGLVNIALSRQILLIDYTMTVNATMGR